MIYQEVAPRAELRPFIKCFWILEDPAPSCEAIERVVPDGRMEMIFQYGKPFERRTGEDFVPQSSGVITGQIRSPVVLRATGSIGILAVRFHPHGFSSLLSMPSKSLTDNLFSIEDVLGMGGKAVQERILNANTNQERIHTLESYLLSYLPKSNLDSRLPAIVGQIRKMNGIFETEDLAQVFNISTRQVERIFRDQVGLSPNTFGRLTRFQSAISMKLSDHSLSLTDLSQAVGYYDQSHFIKDFRCFSGLTPRQYFTEVHRMADFFTENL